VRFLLTPGQAADVGQGAAWLEGLDAGAAIAHKGYDSNELVARIERGGAEAVIPPKTNRKVPRAYDEHLSKERNKVERFINLIKQYRRVATRYEKTARNFLGFLHLASILVLLR
jgi:transposase